MRFCPKWRIGITSVSQQYRGGADFTYKTALPAPSLPSNLKNFCDLRSIIYCAHARHIRKCQPKRLDRRSACWYQCRRMHHYCATNASAHHRFGSDGKQSSDHPRYMHLSPLIRWYGLLGNRTTALHSAYRSSNCIDLICAAVQAIKLKPDRNGTGCSSAIIRHEFVAATGKK